MSGTLNPTRVRSELGIQEDKTDEDIGELRLNSPFPKENRPLHICFVCDTGFPKGALNPSEVERIKRERMMKYFIPKIRSLLERHQTHKGVIFTQSYKNTEYLKEGLRESRLLFHDSHRQSRESVVKAHVTSPLPTVIVSPSLTEGLDLSGDLGRFCIILKVPFADVSAPYTKERRDNDPEWYADLAARTLIQESGRVCRHLEDWAHTYILDLPGFNVLFRSPRLFRNWWLDARVSEENVIPSCDCRNCAVQRANYDGQTNITAF